MANGIIRQFVMETTLIAIAGGTMGLLLGASMSRLIASFAGWSTHHQRRVAATGFSVSVMIGLVSGVYPAMKASRLDPVQALHYE
jgi:putative ABC transport system permease protein